MDFLHAILTADQLLVIIREPIFVQPGCTDVEKFRALRDALNERFRLMWQTHTGTSLLDDGSSSALSRASRRLSG